MDRQDELLEKEDGRYYAIDKVGTGLGSIATSEKLKKKIVSFGLPSGPALFLHLAHCAYSKVKSIDPLFKPAIQDRRYFAKYPYNKA